MKHVAIYVRVSSNQQSTRSQLPDLECWAKAQSEPVKFYTDHATGKNMDRPGWQKLETAISLGKISAVICWRIDRLGRTAKFLAALFHDLQTRKVNLISLKEGINLSTPAGRMLAVCLAGMAQFETEVRGERVAAGLAVARAKGKKFGGSIAGVRKKVKPAQERAIRSMKAAGEPITVIAQTVKLSRPTIYSVLAG